MKIGLFTDGLMHLPFEQGLAAAAHMGVQAVEIGTGEQVLHLVYYPLGGTSSITAIVYGDFLSASR
jgi:sugar phosphate isomerase/epimerase